MNVLAMRVRDAIEDEMSELAIIFGYVSEDFCQMPVPLSRSQIAKCRAFARDFYEEAAPACEGEMA